MSMDNVKAFSEKIATDELLKQQVGALAKQGMAEQQVALLALAEQVGLPFTADELNEFSSEQAQATAASGELSDSQLEQVAGGSVGGAVGLSLRLFHKCYSSL